jgi:hypothetical protein
MGGLTKVQLIIGNLQFIGMLRNINVPFPSIYINFSSFSDLISIDPAFIQSINANIPVLTFRLLFIAVAILFPCMLMIFTTLIFVNFPTIQWAAFSLMSVFLATMIIVIQYTPSYAVVTLDVTSPFFLYTTVASCVYCAIFKGISRVFPKQRGSLVRYFVKQFISPAMLFAGSSLARFENDVLRVVFCICMLMCFSFAYKSSLSRGMKGVSFIITAGGGVWFYMKATRLKADKDFPKALMIPGYIQIVLSGLGWIQFLLRSNDDKSFGRVFVKARQKIQSLLDKGLLAVSFFFLSSAFIPVVTFSLQNWVCRLFECPTGYKFNPYVPSDSLTTFNASAMCDPCQFRATCAFNANQLCPAFRDRRLAFYPETRCNDSGAFFFKAASIIVLFIFLPLISLMYYKVISIITSTLAYVAEKILQDLQAEYARIKLKRTERERERQIDGLLSLDDPFARQNFSTGNNESLSGDLRGQDDSGRKFAGLEAPLLRLPMREERDNFDLDPFSLSHASVEMTPITTGGAPTDATGASPRNRSKSINDSPRNRTKSTIDELEDALKPPTMQDAVTTASTRIVPRAGCLYNEFRRGEYYFIFAVMTHRLALVIINVFVAPFSGYAALANLTVNSVMCIVQVIRRPFQHPLEQKLSFIVLFSMVLNSLYATLLWQLPDNSVLTSSEMAIALVVVTGGIPLVCGVIMQILSVLDTFRSNPYAKVEKERKKQELEDRKAAEQELQNEIATADLFEEDEKVAELKQKLAMMQVKQETYEEKMTDALDNRTKKIIVIFFLVSVPMLLGALGLTLWATINAEPAEFADGSSLLDRSVALVLAGRRNWTDFAATCCSMPSITSMTGFNVTERWVCSNITTAAAMAFAVSVSSPLTISRNRQAVVISNGLKIRNLSEVIFNEPFEQCNVTVDAERSDIVAFVCPHSVKSLSDSLSLAVLW